MLLYTILGRNGFAKKKIRPLKLKNIANIVENTIRDLSRNGYFAINYVSGVSEKMRRKIS